ncbi:MAG: hypothetical protein KKA35_01805, partial [Proteobacteria bacterium]|nr:hypothetical protein [Pseudomonadota bacterium]
ICRAQDFSKTKDGGVARHYSLINGWGPSYPETTGYIIPTIIKYAEEINDKNMLDRALKMLDWLVSIQFPDGGFQAGTVEAKVIVPTTFNTGQILLGLAEGTRKFGDRYRGAMKKAADWIVQTQDSDGCWRKYPTPFAQPGEKSYETHVAWGLLEAAEVDCNEKYLSSALANVRWAIHYQEKNGWFAKCCLDDPDRPLTHTLGYVFRGILEAYKHSKDEAILNACIRIGDGLLTTINKNGFVPGRLLPDWKPAVRWVCLTGSVQIAYCWFMLYEYTNDKKYLNAALSVNKFVRRTQKTEGPEEVRGAIKGSFPVFGGYGTYEYLNWAAKFFIDSNLKEMQVMNAIGMD